MTNGPSFGVQPIAGNPVITQASSISEVRLPRTRDIVSGCFGDSTLARERVDRPMIALTVSDQRADAYDSVVDVLRELVAEDLTKVRIRFADKVVGGRERRLGRTLGIGRLAAFNDWSVNQITLLACHQDYTRTCL